MAGKSPAWVTAGCWFKAPPLPALATSRRPAGSFSNRASLWRPFFAPRRLPRLPQLWPDSGIQSTARRGDERRSGRSDWREVVGAARLERATYGLEGRCSIQLSYAPTLNYGATNKRGSAITGREKAAPVSSNRSLRAGNEIRNRIPILTQDTFKPCRFSGTSSPDGTSTASEEARSARHGRTHARPQPPLRAWITAIFRRAGATRGLEPSRGGNGRIPKVRLSGPFVRRVEWLWYLGERDGNPPT
jgi:hypothetical protein